MLPPKLPLAIETRRLTSFDGTEIAYHVTPARDPEAPWVVLANGLGGTYLAWRALIDYLGDRYRFVTWDYRGLYASGRPSPDRREAYAIPLHARDLHAILRQEKIERAAFIGWSMGVQVLLEAIGADRDAAPAGPAGLKKTTAWPTAREVARALVLLNGTFGRPLDTLSPVPGAARVLPSLVELARHAHALATRVARSATGLPEAAAWFKRLGLMADTLDDGVFAELVLAFGDLDMEPFFRNLAAIGAHDASPVLPSVTVPSLVITGDRDAMTPPSLAEHMASRIPQAELLVVRGGTHYTAIEFPELVNLRIERFLRAHGFDPRAPSRKSAA